MDAVESASEFDKALDETLWWHDQCMTRRHVSGPNSRSFDSAWSELNRRITRLAALRTKVGDEH